MGINIVGGVLVTTLRLPLYLDTIGTILVAVLAGPWVGALTGIITNTVLGVTANPTLLPYALVSAFIAQRARAFATLLGPLITGALIASDTRAMALEARGFSRTCRRTHLAVQHYGTLDRAAVWVSGLVFLIALALKVV